MLLALGIVSALVLLSSIFSAISLFTYGWATIYPYNPLYPLVGDSEIYVGLVPFDSTQFGWLVATSVFMYLNFTCILICFLFCMVGLLIFMLRGDAKYQKFVFVCLCGFTFLTAVFGAVAFVIFVASYSGELQDAFQAEVTIGYSPFLDLFGFVIAIIATGVSAFFSIALLNSEDEN